MLNNSSVQVSHCRLTTLYLHKQMAASTSLRIKRYYCLFGRNNQAAIFWDHMLLHIFPANSKVSSSLWAVLPKSHIVICVTFTDKWLLEVCGEMARRAALLSTVWDGSTSLSSVTDPRLVSTLLVGLRHSVYYLVWKGKVKSWPHANCHLFLVRSNGVDR
jgi:hypothetical protein